MSLNPRVIRAEPHAEIGETLQRNVGVVLERWSRRAAEEQPNAQRVHHDVLLNRLSEFLQTLARALAESDDADDCTHCDVASLHGEQRWETGWVLTEVIRDFQILRLVIFDFLEEALDRPLRCREVLAVGLALDEAIAASVARYVEERDARLRELEEKRTEDFKEIQKRLLEQAEALRDADRRKNEFLAMLAHELRNPLAPVRNVMKVLGLKKASEGNLKWAQEVIERQVQQMARMVDDLLDVSRITLGKVKLEKQAVELSTVVMRAVEVARPFIDGRKHRLEVSLPSEASWLDADAARLTQIFVNLLTNAAKYTDEGGTIWLTGERQAGEIVLKVRDTGIGIPADLLPRVFDPFTQGERSLAQAEGGLGIGLTLVRTFVDLHGGRIQAFSPGRGQGSEFVVYLPLLERAPRPLSEDAAKWDGRQTSRRILVVDDNVDAATSLGMLLQLSGHNVVMAHDGPAALESARTFLPEVVLLDIGLPRMDGLEVGKRMREDLGMKEALLVALTGYGRDEDRQRSQEAGFNAHLVKPVDLDLLHAMLAPRDGALPST